MNEQKKPQQPSQAPLQKVMTASDATLVFPRWFLGSSEGGMSKREYFAGLAMQGLMDPYKDCALPTDQLVAQAVETADALIRELKK